MAVYIQTEFSVLIQFEVVQYRPHPDLGVAHGKILTSISSSLRPDPILRDSNAQVYGPVGVSFNSGIVHSSWLIFLCKITDNRSGLTPASECCGMRPRSQGTASESCGAKRDSPPNKGKHKSKSTTPSKPVFFFWNGCSTTAGYRCYGNNQGLLMAYIKTPLSPVELSSTSDGSTFPPRGMVLRNGRCWLMIE
jgi:hypothetical protein